MQNQPVIPCDICGQAIRNRDDLMVLDSGRLRDDWFSPLKLHPACYCKRPELLRRTPRVNSRPAIMSILAVILVVLAMSWFLFAQNEPIVIERGSWDWLDIFLWLLVAAYAGRFAIIRLSSYLKYERHLPEYSGEESR